MSMNKGFILFFRQLAENNNTQWFNQNRKIYEQEVKQPFTELVEEMITRIREFEPEVQISASDAIMRINKDIRFSKDKTPYNTHMAANISAYGKKDKAFPGFYFKISPDGIEIFGGVYMPDNAMLQRIRTYIADHTDEFTKACSDAAFRKKYGSIQGEQSKRLPEEFRPFAVKEPLIANKQFYYTAKLPAKHITAEELPELLMEYYHAGKKMNDFLKSAIMVNSL